MSTSGALNRKLGETIKAWADPPQADGAVNRNFRWIGDFALGFSLTNLWLLPLWKRVLLFAPVSAASMTGEPSATLYLASITLVFTGAALFALAAFAVRSVGRTELTRPAKIGFILGVLLLVRWEIIVPVILIALAIAAHVGAKKLGLVLRVIRVVVLLFVPFAIGVVAQLAWKSVQARPVATYAQAFPRDGVRVPRAIVLVFDGLDSRVLAPNDSGFVAKAFNSLRAQSFAATAAESPSASTNNSLPTLIQGASITYAEDAGFEDTRLYAKGSDTPVLWKSAGPNLFNVARSRRLNVAVAGWYHAYCDIFRDILVRCFNYSYYGMPSAPGWLATARELVRANLDMEAAKVRAHAQRHASMAERGLRLAIDPELDLVFIHYCLPHRPWIAEERSSGYLGNVMEVDRTLARLREAMERAGLWNDALLVVTSDHGTSFAEDVPKALGLPLNTVGKVTRKVPFLVKLPGQHTGFEYSDKLNTRMLRQIVEDVQSGRISTVDQLAARIADLQRASTS